MKVPDLVSRVGQILLDQFGIRPEGNVLAAVSGGPDSVALADILHKLGYLGGIAHCNFGLRAEAHAETAQVLSMQETYSVPVFVQHFSTETHPPGKHSTQAWARALRYAFFSDCLAAQRLQHCATAHHRDDNVENILMGLLRGHDERGLRGMVANGGEYIRPLLEIGKQELLDYCVESGLSFSIDSSNLEAKYLRNQFRLQLVPVLKALNPDFEERLLEAAKDNEIRTAWMDRHFEGYRSRLISANPEGIQLSFTVAEELELPLPLVLPWWLRTFGLSGQQIRTVMHLQDAQAGKEVSVGGKRFVRNHSGIQCMAAERASEPFEVLISDPGADLRAGPWEIEFRKTAFEGSLPEDPKDWWEYYYMDAGRLTFPLLARSWKLGDRIQPYGMQGSKKLSDIFVDRHASESGKANALVLVDARGEVVLLSGFRISAKVALDAGSKEMVRMRCRFTPANV